jgi:hypothetical protein
VPFPVMLTEGFGALPMEGACRDLLERSSGSTVSMFTRTQIRAGVVRPMVILPT